MKAFFNVRNARNEIAPQPKICKTAMNKKYVEFM